MTPEPLPSSQNCIDSHRHLLLGSILLLALSLRIFSIISLKVTPGSDALDFHTIALNLVAGNGFTLDGLPTASRAPGYPFFLAAVYSLTQNSLFAVQLAQAFLETSICFLLYGLGRIGLAALTRSFALILPVVLTLRMYWNKEPFIRIIKVTAAVVLVSGIIVTPWIIRNVKTLGTLTMDTNAGVNLWMGNNPHTTGAYRFPKENNPLLHITDEVERDREGFSLAWKYMKDHPLTCLTFIPRKIAFLFSSESPLAVSLTHRFSPETGKRYAKLYSEVPVFLHIGINIHYILFIVLGIVGLMSFPPHARETLRMILAFIGYWIVIHALFVGLSRYHYPLMPFFVLSSAHTLFNISEIREQLTAKKKVLLVAFIVTFFGILIAEVVTALAEANR